MPTRSNNPLSPWFSLLPPVIEPGTWTWDDLPEDFTLSMEPPPLSYEEVLGW